MGTMPWRQVSAERKEKKGLDEPPAYRHGVDEVSVPEKISTDNTHRNLKPRHIQLIGIGGTIGTALFVQIGRGLLSGGPASLFLAFSWWCTFILAITMCMAEMVTYLPISSPFVRFAGRFVDEAFGVAVGWNFFIFEAALVPFEIVACNFIIHYWSDAVPAAAIITLVIILYAAFNFFAVKWYGESEFWLSLGKLVLIIGVLFYTFVTMIGGNPLGDRYGFRYWRDPGAFAPTYTTGSLGLWLGFLQCLILASFTVSGPDYVSMAAGEAENPRVSMPKAFKAVFYRLSSFFMLGSLAIGVNVPYNDKTMQDAFLKDLPGATASPYVISMRRLQIHVLPDIINAMVLSASFSAGNSYVYCASRCLYGLALEGKAPRIFTRCAKNGVPVYCVGIVLIIALLSFLQVSSSASVVLQWFVNLVTASQLINFSAITFTYIRFYKAMKAQGISRDSLPFKSRFQPYLSYYGFTGPFAMVFIGGYSVFLPGNWSLATFFFSYAMVAVFPLIFLGWKWLKRTKFLKPEEVDLIDGVDEIEEYTRNYVSTPPGNLFEKILNFIF
ncbi:general amino acid permease AGP2 [Trichophyton equinum CBS 127.97]|uniref:General amino acid permease AGP2 n=1 Tax=Trichophyton equinum (strain ATCC MYA-4606 / CBS 127.97) TaxID=559882 RepID=F2Q1U8_TRIEC|nr:general amino acid permease AGP2 [Trichophyton equinum CBS 127.97]